MHRELALELFRAFGVHQVHVNRLAQDGTLGRGTMYRPQAAEVLLEQEYVLPLDTPSAVREVVRTKEPFNEPDAILYKPGPLTDEEWVVMREHPLIGEGILRRTPELAGIAPLVRHEHERWDGCGYPDGLAREEIPVDSRIIFACDAYSAMITARPYREPMSQAAAVEELRNGAGSQFDPAVVSCLLEVLE